MKVLIIYPYFGTPKGSWSTRMYELSKRWILQGADIEVITAPYEKSDIKATRFIEAQKVEGINLTVINSGDNNRLTVKKRALKSILFSVTATLMVLTKRYDVLLVSSGPITVGIPMLFAKFLLRKKTIFEVRDLWPEGAIQMKKINNTLLILIAQWFEKICYRSADRVVAASLGMKEYIMDIMNIKEKIFVYPNASDIELFQIPPTEPSGFIEALLDKLILIYTGSLGEMDECATAIRAMAHFKDKKIALVFLGDGVERKKLEILAKNSGNNNIFFLGLISKEEVVKWYSIAHASLVGFQDYPVLHTSSPNKMFDSFAAGVPIIQNTQGWIKDLIDINGGGFNVQPNDVKSYVCLFEKLLENQELISTEGSRAFDLAKNKFNRNRIAKDYLDMLKDLWRS